MSVGSWATKLWHKATGTPTSKEKRAQSGAMKEQSEYYKAATSELAEQGANLKAMQDNERKRRNEKLLRSIGVNKRPMMRMGDKGSANDGGLSNITG